MTTLKQRDRLETVERPVEEKKRAGRGLWLAAAALVVAVAAGVTGFVLFGSGESESSYVPNGAEELQGFLTEPVFEVPPPRSTYVPGRHELRDALAEAAEPRSDYVPGPYELRDALAWRDMLALQAASAEQLEYR